MKKASEILRRNAEEKARVKPLPRVRGTTQRPPDPLPVRQAGRRGKTESPQETEPEIERPSSNLLVGLENEFGQMKRDRGKLSSSICMVVDEVEARLRAQSPALAEEFLKGNMPVDEVGELYAKIEAHTDRGAELYGQMEHVKLYGTIPIKEEKKVELRLDGSADAGAIKHEIRRLDDLIHKKTKNIAKVNAGIKAPKNSGRPAQWREMIALAEARRFELRMKLKNL